MSSSPIPRLRVLAGPSPSQLTDISSLVNTARPHSVSSSRFEGRMVVHVKGFPGAEEGEYFEREDRKGITWSIQVQGRFLQPYSADDVLFGNTFDRPLKLPWGSGAALKFMNFIDPTLEHDLGGPKPWALSPLIATMPHFAHERILEASEHHTQLPSFPLPDSIGDDTAQLMGCGGAKDRRHTNGDDSGSGSSSGNSSGSGSDNENRDGKGTKRGASRLTTASKRRTYFADAKHRRQITFGPEDVLTTDFCYGFLSFPSLALNLPGGISFDLKKYWDGQPVRFVCMERQRPENSQGEAEDSDDGSDRTFWCVVIEADED